MRFKPHWLGHSWSKWSEPIATNVTIISKYYGVEISRSKPVPALRYSRTCSVCKATDTKITDVFGEVISML